MIGFIRAFIQDERGQDFIEYSLLVGFVAIVGIAVLSGSQTGVKGIWAHGNAPPIAVDSVLD